MQDAPTLQAFLSLRYSAGGHPVTRHVIQYPGAVLAWLSLRCGLSPNAVTVLATSVSVLGACSYALFESETGVVLALVLTQLGYALDCADGQLARATARQSRLGGWLDVYCDMLSITTLAVAVLIYPLLHGQELTLELVIAIGAYTFARVGHLLTCTMARMWPRAETRSSPKRSLPQLAFLVAMDTPVVLLIVCTLRELPALQPAGLLALAALFTAHGVFVGTSHALRADLPG